MINYPKNPRLFEVGEDVYNLLTNSVDTIRRIEEHLPYAIETDTHEYTIEGKRLTIDTLRTLYHLSELPLTITAQLPRPEIKKDTKVRVRDKHTRKWENIYATGEFDEDGRILCYESGATSFSNDSDPVGWKYYKVVEDE